ncbi:MAG: MerR family transcriptional regulator [Alphaproteobacteria bacterium]|nr:MerR family transcriptional regulator [Alphaproteobacteria bacterium]
MDGEYFVSINEVAKRLDIPAHTLRYWEKQFPTAIRPTTGAGGRRYYRPETVERLETIKSLLYDRGMTIAGVKKILHNGEFNDEVNAVKSNTDTTMVFSPVTAAPDKKSLEAAINFLEQAKTFLE